MTFLNSETASSKTFEETSDLLKTDIKFGLSQQEIQTRRRLYGFNEFEIKQDDPFWMKYMQKVVINSKNKFLMMKFI